eukprot:m.137684 g.137684  ORF g.137684 m.137684 type:complete len:547 (+) comp16608_c0_seq2:319-1959(+)
MVNPVPWNYISLLLCVGGSVGSALVLAEQWLFQRLAHQLQRLLALVMLVNMAYALVYLGLTANRLHEHYTDTASPWLSRVCGSAATAEAVGNGVRILEIALCAYVLVAVLRRSRTLSVSAEWATLWLTLGMIGLTLIYYMAACYDQCRDGEPDLSPTGTANGTAPSNSTNSDPAAVARCSSLRGTKLIIPDYVLGSLGMFAWTVVEIKVFFQRRAWTSRVSSTSTTHSLTRIQRFTRAKLIEVERTVFEETFQRLQPYMLGFILYISLDLTAIACSNHSHITCYVVCDNLLPLRGVLHVIIYFSHPETRQNFSLSRLYARYRLLRKTCGGTLGGGGIFPVTGVDNLPWPSSAGGSSGGSNNGGAGTHASTSSVASKAGVRTRVGGTVMFSDEVQCKELPTISNGAYQLMENDDDDDAAGDAGGDGGENGTAAAERGASDGGAAAAVGAEEEQDQFTPNKKLARLPSSVKVFKDRKSGGGDDSGLSDGAAEGNSTSSTSNSNSNSSSSSSSVNKAQSAGRSKGKKAHSGSSGGLSERLLPEDDNEDV